MALRAKKPEAIQKRLKLFMFGGYGVGKTKAAIKFPKAYIIDGEKGTENYTKDLEAAGSVVYPTTDAEETVEEVRSLKTEKHDYLTLVVDPMTTIETDLIEKAEKEFGPGDMRIWGKRDRVMRRLFNLIMSLDMNVIVTAHGKIDYGEKMVKLGTTFDGWKRLPYIFDLVLELEKRGQKRVAIVRKTRLEGFKDGEEFEFSYAEVAKRYGEEVIARAAVPVAVASPEQVATLKGLIEAVKLEEGTVDKWLAKASVESIDDLPADIADKCITFIKQKLPGEEKKAS